MTVRRGFALLAMLWLMSLASVLSLDATLLARDDVAASANRADQIMAEWRAYDCMERARSDIDAALESARHDGGIAAVWRSLDRRMAIALPEDCSLRLEAAGARIDVNSVQRRQLLALLEWLNVPDPVTATERLLDWRAVHGGFADVRQLRRVAGFDELARFDSVLSVEPGSVPLNSAPIAVLASLPGMTRETLARIAIDRAAGRDIVDIMAVAASVSRSSADSIMAHFPELSRLTTVNPEAWLLTARGLSGTPPLFVELEARLVLAEDRATISRMRSRR